MIKYNIKDRFIKGPIYLKTIYLWVKCAGPLGGLVFILLSHRKNLDRTHKKVWFSLPKELTQGFGIGFKGLRRLRRDLTKGGLIETKRNPGRPWQYRIIARE